jgi:hypothetical protein
MNTHTTDLRLKQLSYSSRLTLHSCPRKYQLYRMNVIPEQEEQLPESVTFAFGTVVGLGIQELLIHASDTKAIYAMYLAWEPDLLADNIKQVKSFWFAVSAIQKFQSLQNAGFLTDYELVSYLGKPAVELSFIITFPDGFTYKGFVDAVLRHKVTGEAMVLEVKTTSANSVNAASYKNSAQAVGYSIVLDALFPTLSSYLVKYLVYKTKGGGEYEVLDFEKSYLSRALWIKELLLDIEMIKLYDREDIYPMHGESCNDFYRECEYLNICTLATSKLIEPLSEEGERKLLESVQNDFQVKLDIAQLIEVQLSKET